MPLDLGEELGEVELGRAGSTGGVEVGSVDAGADLPYFVVDGRSSVWEHVARLAELSGFAAWVDDQLKLPELAVRMGRLNPYQQSLEEIRHRLVTLVGEVLAGA